MSTTNPSNPKKKLILVVDDQPEMRKSLSRILRMAGYSIAEAENGFSAITFMENNEVDLVLSDLRMPGMDGIELLHRVRAVGSLPFVLMTGFAEILESTEAYELGADGFLLKPFTKEELLPVLAEALPGHEVTPTLGEGVPKSEFCGIPVGEFISGREIKFPIFLKLSEHKHVRIAHCGEDLSSDKIQKLRDKGVNLLYLHREDFKNYLSFAARVTESVVQNKHIDSSRKADFLRHSSEAILEFGFNQHVDKEIFELACLNVEQSLSILSDDPSLLKILETLTAHSAPLYAHSVGVAMVSCLVAKSLGWASSPLFFRIVAGAIFHDLGKKDFPPALWEKRPSEMSKEEYDLWRTHPKIGADLLATVEDLPAEIVQIVSHHHENPDGSGFPLGISSPRIHPVAKVIALSDEFFKLYRGERGIGPGLSPSQAVLEIESQAKMPGSPYPRWENVSALRKTFRLD